MSGGGRIPPRRSRNRGTSPACLAAIRLRELPASQPPPPLCGHRARRPRPCRKPPWRHRPCHLRRGSCCCCTAAADKHTNISNSTIAGPCRHRFRPLSEPRYKHRWRKFVRSSNGDHPQRHPQLPPTSGPRPPPLPPLARRLGFGRQTRQPAPPQQHPRATPRWRLVRGIRRGPKRCRRKRVRRPPRTLLLSAAVVRARPGEGHGA
mmetsp:Transcript_54754/g.159113  ORF Transcript_54754/g.159113 Transcript_54754/m.159113 type:complete len:206 (+) Transcript_54754:766-1383(+)